MSSSDSSEDEEETKKINDAIIPNDLLFSLSSPCGPFNPNEESESHRRNSKLSSMQDKTKSNIQSQEDNVRKNVEVQHLKSKRSDKAFDDEEWSHAYILKTTPEFRAHIEKHLIKALDREIEATLRESVWKKSKYNLEKNETGIKLFSGVKELCYGEVKAAKDEVPVIRNRQKIRPKKHKLNSDSSESSEEEKISSCVFTLDDILHENQMLTDLSKSGVEQQAKDENNRSDGVTGEDRTQDTEKKKEKKKKEKHSDDDAKTDSLNDNIHKTNEAKSVKKKKKKKSQTIDKVP